LIYNVIDREALEQRLTGHASDFVSDLETYMAEADAFFAIVQDDLSHLDPGTRIIEIGSGIGLLSLFIAAKGFKVASVEPQSNGFGRMHDMRELVMSSWVGPIPHIEWLEDLPHAEEGHEYGYALAINVLEHVPDWAALTRSVVNLLGFQGKFRAIFPNYLWPYEPHFNMPTMFNKRLTENLFRRRISSSEMDSPLAFWRDLSWLTGTKLRREFQGNDVTVDFKRQAFMSYLERLSGDPIFLKRKGIKQTPRLEFVSSLAQIVFRPVPSLFLPILDCTFTKPT
jgi:hypothetical protein